jgi:hypothetical protein
MLTPIRIAELVETRCRAEEVGVVSPSIILEQSILLRNAKGCGLSNKLVTERIEVDSTLFTLLHYSPSLM